MTTEEIIAGWKSGLVTNDAFVWKDGMADWVAILECEEFRSVLPAPAATPDPTATPFGPTIVTAPTAGATKGLPAARVTGGRARGGVDLFDAVEGGGEDDVATSAPAFPGMAGTQPYDDGKLTGARNENSVLFSLDALKGGLTVEPKKKSAPTREVASDPLVASPASVLGGGASPLFSLSADQALLTAPAAPDPPPRSADAAGGRGRAPNKLVLYGGGGAAVVAVLSLGILVGQSGKDEATAEAAASASAAAEKKAAATKEEKKEEKKEEEKKEEAKTEASASPASSTSATAKKGTGGPPSEKKGPTPTPTATGTPTATATEKKEEAAPAAGTAPFSVSAAQVELTKAAGNAGSCKKPDGPTGSGKVKVTFATSGRVTSANVDGPPFAGTPTGGCIAGVFRRAKVPPFAGNPVTVSKSFSIK
jgi:cytoskeletal protein RodZ